MLAAAFISFGIANIFTIICGILLGILCVLGAIFAVGSKYGPVPFIAFALFFFIGMGIVLPHDSTVNGRHHKQVFVDLPNEYGRALTIVNNSVQDHWVEFRLKSCGDQTYRYDNLRLIDGHYWFATVVIGKDKQGAEYNSYKPIARKSLPAICQTAAAVST